MNKLTKEIIFILDKLKRLEKDIEHLETREKYQAFDSLFEKISGLKPQINNNDTHRFNITKIGMESLHGQYLKDLEELLFNTQIDKLIKSINELIEYYKLLLPPPKNFDECLLSLDKIGMLNKVIEKVLSEII